MPAALTRKPSLQSKPPQTQLRQAGIDHAKKHCAHVFAKSNCEDLSDEFPKFSGDELVMGKILGKGGFCTVNEIRAFQIGGQVSPASKMIRRGSRRHGGDGTEDEQVDFGEMEGKEFIAEHCIRNGGDARYAVKYLSKENVENDAMFFQGIKDMAIETRFLSSIEHPNIVKMRALARVDPFDANYFIIMDRLYDTLEKRLKKWAAQNRRNSGLLGKAVGGKKKNEALWEERLVDAFDLSSALEYLHKRKIVYRDMKPDNIGFDVRGDIKIFDFGLAREILPQHMKEEDCVGDDTYRMSGDTGSVRYMAPEVALDKPYNFKVDTYSFSIVLWEMLALKKPFELYTMKTFKTRVWIENGKRPQVNDAWPVQIKLVLTKGWTDNISERFSMASVTTILREELVRIRDGNDSGLEHQRRRSTFVFHKSKEQLPN